MGSWVEVNVTEPIYLPDNWDTLEYECLSHNVTEAARIGAKAFIREGRKELTMLRNRICPPRKYGRPPPKAKPIPPLNRDRLLAEYEAVKHNIIEAHYLGAQDYIKVAMRELKRLDRLIQKWVLNGA